MGWMGVCVCVWFVRREGPAPLHFNIFHALTDSQQEGVVTELWLSSEDTGAYGRDLPFPPGGDDDDDDDERRKKQPGLTRLLEALLPLLPPGVMLRLGMTNPPFILDQLDAVAAALRHPNVFSFLHVPVQAGSDAVRDLMMGSGVVGLCVGGGGLSVCLFDCPSVCRSVGLPACLPACPPTHRPNQPTDKPPTQTNRCSGP